MMCIDWNANKGNDRIKKNIFSGSNLIVYKTEGEREGRAL